jgi:hypothetical protein
MKAYWANDGKPLPDGRLCYVTDLEDGSNPVNTYGKDVQEVLDKLARTNANAQLALAKQQAAAMPQRRRLTAEETMEVTADLANPAKSQGAVVKLFESATGIDTREMILQKFGERCLAWQAKHPEFYDHPVNSKLLVDNARMRTGGDLSRITEEVLNQVYEELQAGNYLLQESEVAPQPKPTTQEVHPEENPAQSTPRRGATATSFRSNRIATPQVATTRTVKYTREQIESMPLEKSRALVESNDRDYEEAVNFHFGSGARTA